MQSDTQIQIQFTLGDSDLDAMTIGEDYQEFSATSDAELASLIPVTERRDACLRSTENWYADY
jgi:hypothetical protein